MTTRKLTAAQERAAIRLTDKWQDAYTLKASLATLDALVRLGLAERQREQMGNFFSPRITTFYRVARNKGTVEP